MAFDECITSLPSILSQSTNYVDCITFVSETWLPEINGVSHTLNAIAQGLAAKNWQIQLIRPQPRQQQSFSYIKHELQVTALVLPNYPQVQLGFALSKRLRQFWQQYPCNIVYIATEGPLGLAALKAARQLNLIIISGFHTNFHDYSQYYWLLRLVSPLVLRYLRYWHNHTDLTLVPTNKQARKLASVGIKHLAIMGRGLDSIEFNVCYRSNDLRLQWQANANDCVVLYVGRLAAEKNMSLLMQTLQALKRQNPQQHAIIVGDGPLKGWLAENLPWVYFAGFLTGQTLAQYYASADLFLFPSLTETYGNVVIEAMASGLAVIAFARGAADELIESTINGYTINPNTPQQFIKTALLLSQKLHLVHQLGIKASKRVDTLNWQQIINLFIAYIEQTKEEKNARQTSPAL